MPPCPRSAAISYGPSRIPGGSAMLVCDRILLGRHSGPRPRRARRPSAPSRAPVALLGAGRPSLTLGRRGGGRTASPPAREASPAHEVVFGSRSEPCWCVSSPARESEPCCEAALLTKRALLSEQPRRLIGAQRSVKSGGYRRIAAASSSNQLKTAMNDGGAASGAPLRGRSSRRKLPSGNTS